MDVAKVDGRHATLAISETPTGPNPDLVWQIDFKTLWRQLMAGRWLMEARFSEGSESLLVLRQPRSVRPVSPLSVSALEKVLLGQQLKSVADDLGLSMSSISVYLSNGLSTIGAGRSISQCSILLVIAAHANVGHVEPRLALRGWDNDTTLTVGVRTPGDSFRLRLTPSEWDVARLAIEGMTTQGIAELRQACPRTIANQFASIYQKLRVSGRAALRALAVTEPSRFGLDRMREIER